MPHIAFPARLASVTLVCMTLGARADAQTQGGPNLCQPVVLNDVALETSKQIEAAGSLVMPKGLVGPTGFDWNDTQLGAVSDGDGKYLFFGSDGSCHANCNRPGERDGSITRTLGTLDTPLGIDPPTETVLPQSRTLPPYMIYAGGGSLFRVPPGDPAAGAILLVYQAARASYAAPHHYPDCDRSGFCNADQNGFYSYLGLAESTDAGESFTNLGLIVAANQPYDAQLTFDIGGGSLVTGPAGAASAQQYLYVYFPDLIRSRSSGGLPTRMSVARVPYLALLEAIVSGRRLPAFQKYENGAWNQPGLGGTSSDLLKGVPGLGAPPGQAHYDMVVIWNAYVQRYAGIFNNTHTIKYAESTDGLTWSAPTTLAPHINENVQVAKYATPMGLDGDPSVLGGHFSITYNFQQYYGNNAGWPSAQLRALDVACESWIGSPKP